MIKVRRRIVGTYFYRSQLVGWWMIGAFHDLIADRSSPRHITFQDDRVSAVKSRLHRFTCLITVL